MNQNLTIQLIGTATRIREGHGLSLRLARRTLLLCIFLLLLLPCMAQINDYFEQSNISELKSRIEALNQNIAEKGIVPLSGSDEKLLTGYVYAEFYDWDLYFDNIYLSYYGISHYCFTNLKEFLSRQHLNGFVSRTLLEPRAYQHFKPFLAQIALLGSRQTVDYTWLLEVVNPRYTGGEVPSDWKMNTNFMVDGRSYFDRLEKYLFHWFWYMDFDKNGLPVWNSADHSGMDNQDSRAGFFNAFRYEGVDLACYLVRELQAMEVIAGQLGKLEKALQYRNEARTLIEKINTHFWNEDDGFYYDRDEHTGEQVRVKSVAGLLPLFVGAPSEEQAERLVKEHLLNEEEFWLPFPVPAYAKSEPDYSQDVKDHGCNWRGTTWIPTNYMIIHGLIDYGYIDLARELTKNTFRMVLEQNPSLREYYNAETGEGLGLDPFFGWSSLGYFLPLELEMDYSPSDISEKRIRPIANEILEIKFPTVK